MISSADDFGLLRDLLPPSDRPMMADTDAALRLDVSWRMFLILRPRHFLVLLLVSRDFRSLLCVFPFRSLSTSDWLAVLVSRKCRGFCFRSGDSTNTRGFWMEQMKVCT